MLRVDLMRGGVPIRECFLELRVESAMVKAASKEGTYPK